MTHQSPAQIATFDLLAFIGAVIAALAVLYAAGAIP